MLYHINVISLWKTFNPQPNDHLLSQKSLDKTILIQEEGTRDNWRTTLPMIIHKYARSLCSTIRNFIELSPCLCYQKTLSCNLSVLEKSWAKFVYLSDETIRMMTITLTKYLWLVETWRGFESKKYLRRLFGEKIVKMKLREFRRQNWH